MGESGGWRDTEGRTAADRRKLNDTGAQARFVDTLRRRPLSMVKPMLMLTLAAVLIFALVSPYF
jgi:hypothetical protein